MREIFQDPQWKPEAADGIEPYMYYFSPIHTYHEV